MKKEEMMNHKRPRRALLNTQLEEAEAEAVDRLRPEALDALQEAEPPWDEPLEVAVLQLAARLLPGRICLRLLPQQQVLLRESLLPSLPVSDAW
jgi:hypothetical protein